MRYLLQVVDLKCSKSDGVNGSASSVHIKNGYPIRNHDLPTHLCAVFSISFLHLDKTQGCDRARKNRTRSSSSLKKRNRRSCVGGNGSWRVRSIRNPWSTFGWRGIGSTTVGFTGKDKTLAAEQAQRVSIIRNPATPPVIKQSIDPRIRKLFQRG